MGTRREVNKVRVPRTCSSSCAFEEQKLNTFVTKRNLVTRPPKSPQAGERGRLKTACDESSSTSKRKPGRSFRPRVYTEPPRTALVTRDRSRRWTARNRKTKRRHHNRHMDRWEDRQTGSQPDRQTGRHAGRQAGTHAGTQAGRQADCYIMVNLYAPRFRKDFVTCKAKMASVAPAPRFGPMATVE